MLRNFSRLNEVKEKRNFNRGEYSNRIKYRDKDYQSGEERRYIEEQLEDSGILNESFIPIGISWVIDKNGRLIELPLGEKHEEFDDLIDDIGDELVKLFPDEEHETIEDALFGDIEDSLKTFKKWGYDGCIYDCFLGKTEDDFAYALLSNDWEKTRNVVIYSIDPNIFIQRVKNHDWEESDDEGEPWIVEMEFLHKEDEPEIYKTFYDVLKPIIEEKRKKVPKMLAQAYADFINGKYGK